MHSISTRLYNSFTIVNKLGNRQFFNSGRWDQVQFTDALSCFTVTCRTSSSALFPGTMDEMNCFFYSSWFIIIHLYDNTHTTEGARAWMSSVLILPWPTFKSSRQDWFLISGCVLVVFARKNTNSFHFHHFLFPQCLRCSSIFKLSFISMHLILSTVLTVQ